MWETELNKKDTDPFKKRIFGYDTIGRHDPNIGYSKRSEDDIISNCENFFLETVQCKMNVYFFETSNLKLAKKKTEYLLFFFFFFPDKL